MIKPNQMFKCLNHITVQRLPTLVKYNSFITRSNVFHLNNIKSSDKMNKSGKVNMVCGQVNFWNALSRGKLLLQKNHRTPLIL
jgi:hypothetical protein